MNSGQTYAQRRTDTGLYLRFRGADFEERIRGFINDAIYDFLRIRDWRRLVVSREIVVPSSGVLDLYTSFQSVDYSIPVFAIEKGLYSGTSEVKIVDPKSFIERGQGVATIEGETLKYTGGGTFTFVYVTPGAPYPFTETVKDESPLVLRYYGDIIGSMAACYHLRSIHDDTWRDEENRFIGLIKAAAAQENRAKNATADNVFHRERT